MTTDVSTVFDDPIRKFLLGYTSIIESLGHYRAFDSVYSIHPLIFYIHVCTPSELIGYDMAVKAADEAYQQAGLTVADVNVVELHDCFSTNELIMYEALVRVE